MSKSSVNRNREYEARMRDSGFKKVTLWIPSSMDSDFLEVAEICRRKPNLVLSMLRDTSTGRMVSISRLNAPSPVTENKES